MTYVSDVESSLPVSTTLPAYRAARVPPTQSRTPNRTTPAAQPSQNRRAAPPLTQHQRKAAMTKQDFELIARVLRDRRATTLPTHVGLLDDLAECFAAELATTNARFDRTRFIAACMGEDATDSAGRRVRYSTDPIAGERR